MDKRKIVSTGGSSFVVTLPIKWVKKHKLDASNEVIFLPLEDGSLLLTHKLERKEYTKTIEISQDTQIAHLKREFYSAYLGGYSNIHITSKSEITPKFRSAIDEISSDLVGVESAGMKKNSIILRNVVYSEGVKYQNFVSTLMEIALTMHENILETLQSKTPNSAMLVPAQDKKINPKNYAITRMMNTYLQDLTLTGALEISLIEAQSYFAVSLFLESIGDNAVLLSRNVVDAINLYKDSEKIDDLIVLFDKLVKIMKQVFTNWENKNKKGIRQPITVENSKKANLLLDKLSSHNDICKKLMKTYQEESEYSVFYGILEKLRQSIKILSNIALVTIDIAEGILKNHQKNTKDEENTNLKK